MGTARTNAANSRWSCATTQMATRLPTTGKARVLSLLVGFVLGLCGRGGRLVGRFRGLGRLLDGRGSHEVGLFELAVPQGRGHRHGPREHHEAGDRYREGRTACLSSRASPSTTDRGRARGVASRQPVPGPVRDGLNGTGIEVVCTTGTSSNRCPRLGGAGHTCPRSRPRTRVCYARAERSGPSSKAPGRWTTTARAGIEARLFRRPLEPACIGFVELRSQLFRHRAVRRLADQQMTEAVRLFAGEK